MVLQIFGNMTAWVFLVDYWKGYTCLAIGFTIAAHYCTYHFTFAAIRSKGELNFSDQNVTEVEKISLIAALTAWVSPVCVLFNNKVIIERNLYPWFTNKFLVLSAGITTAALNLLMALHCLWLVWGPSSVTSGRSLFMCLPEPNMTSSHVCFFNGTLHPFDQVTILPKVTTICLQIYVIAHICKVKIFVAYNQFSLVGQVLCNHLEPILKYYF
jgi:hypothetical protein